MIKGNADEIFAKASRGDKLLSDNASTWREISESQRAEAFLLEYFRVRNEQDLPAKQIEKLAHSAGISKTTLYRARDKIGIHPHKPAFDEPWMWSIPWIIFKSFNTGDSH